jgi:hypothetical protein
MSNTSLLASEDRPAAAVIRRRGLGAVVMAVLATLAPFCAAIAMPAFEGVWSVSIVTDTGACENGNGYAVRITDGVLSDASHIGFIISGTVRESGHVAWAVVYGNRNAAGSGRLSGKSGAGKWSGNSCTGTWSAERQDG